jgi:hypothetical protein
MEDIQNFRNKCMMLRKRGLSHKCHFSGERTTLYTYVVMCFAYYVIMTLNEKFCS